MKTTSQSWFARQGSPEVFITYRTHGLSGMFHRKGWHAWPLRGRFCGCSLVSGGRTLACRSPTRPPEGPSPPIAPRRSQPSVAVARQNDSQPPVGHARTDGCGGIAIDAQGYPSVVVPRAASGSPAMSSPMRRPSVAFIPSAPRTTTAAISHSSGPRARGRDRVFSRVGDPDARYHRGGRARRGASGALYPQSAPAGLNPLPRSGIADPARARRR